MFTTCSLLFEINLDFFGFRFLVSYNTRTRTRTRTRKRTRTRTRTRTFFIELRTWASTGSFLKLSDFEYSAFLTSFLKVP